MSAPSTIYSPGKNTPLIIEWEPGTEKIGDFSWGGYDFIVTNRARLVLKRNHFECGFGRVKVRRPTSFLKSTRPRVAFPYRGPKLYWVRPTERVHIDIKASHIELEPDCPCSACGLQEYKFRRDRLVIRKNEWGGRRIFQIAEFGQSDATFIPESSLEILEQAGLTNFSTRLAGEIR
jgi:hypothetical protein